MGKDRKNLFARMGSKLVTSGLNAWGVNPAFDRLGLHELLRKFCKDLKEVTYGRQEWSAMLMIHENISTSFGLQTLLDDPLYIGIRENRCNGQEYDDLVEEFMTAAVKR